MSNGYVWHEDDWLEVIPTKFKPKPLSRWKALEHLLVCGRAEYASPFGTFGVEWKSDNPSPTLTWIAGAVLPPPEPILPEGMYGVEWKSDSPSPDLTPIY